MYSKRIDEEELKLCVAEDFFSAFDTKRKLKNIDFCVSKRIDKTLGSSLFGSDFDLQSFVWAESKRSNTEDIDESFTQLVLTIGKERTFEHFLPPQYLGAFDCEKFSFIEYSNVSHIFNLSYINWNTTPSNHNTNEFKTVFKLVKPLLDKHKITFNYDTSESDFRKFIRINFTQSLKTKKISITKNNFASVYYKWIEFVKPSIDMDWALAKTKNILDADFYLADLLSSEKKNLSVLLNGSVYEFSRIKTALGTEMKQTTFKDDMKAYNLFWNHYERPPREEFWDFILDRRDLLVPQDIRETKGSYYTPRIWVEKAQEDLEHYFGENWQQEYYVWDCAAGTGNLLVGLTEPSRIWASTLDRADVDIMKDRIQKGASLLEKHVFQFDFLNDDFSSLPQSLKEIINDEEKRKKLIILINPPYAEAASQKNIKGTGHNKTDVAVNTKTYNQYVQEIGIAGRELYAQFLIRIYKEIPNCIIATFSKLKLMQSPNFYDFRNVFKAKLLSCFLAPAYTFDNVKGKFPIGFQIYDSSIEERFNSFTSRVYNSDGEELPTKELICYDDKKTINDWLINTRKRESQVNLGYISCKGCDFQNQNFIFIINNKNQLPHPRGSWITDANIRESCVYLAVRRIPKANWLNDRDQFTAPNDNWEQDSEFITDCIIYTLFSTSNNIKSSVGVNHWIPFKENEVGAKDSYSSHFMIDYLSGIKQGVGGLFDTDNPSSIVLSFEAKNVMDDAKEIYKYYHTKRDANCNASFYDIREYFQGRNDKGVMNPNSDDNEYNSLLEKYRISFKKLSDKIEPKIYEYKFLG
ncbi:MAG: hypothetical protein IJI42_02120 [Methanobrevibacter sp.]|nr:hypothetical protein [Methanobrevibacter sp.]